MVRPKSQHAAQTEAKVQAAMKGLEVGTYSSIWSAANAVGMSHKTLTRRVNGGKSCAQAKENDQHLSAAEEKALVRWILMMTSTGHPVPYRFLGEMAEEIRRQRLCKINDDTITLITYTPLGKRWIQRFLKRHPELETQLTRSIEHSRIKYVSEELVKNFFDKLQFLIKEHDIRPENIYNHDETGISLII
jgi:4-hydroxybenzoate polyprenyltransferase